MSSEQEQIRSIAERVARSVSSSERGSEGLGAGGGDDVSALRAGLEEIQRRLAHIESHIDHEESCDAPQESRAVYSRNARSTQSGGGATAENATPARSLWLSGTYAPATVEHPSQERFDINEAVSEMVDFFEQEKTCNMEPGGKPCDHCGMCSSRGF